VQEQHSHSGADATKQSNIIKKVSSGKTLSKGQLWSLTVAEGLVEDVVPAALSGLVEALES